MKHMAVLIDRDFNKNFVEAAEILSITNNAIWEAWNQVRKKCI